ncbi:ATP-binding protein [Nocardia sp. CA2R105]|uniref:AAA family ATPase n=1 Tax=Nocardia coffeae TaxID=2873381 RepID=UPI001CA702BF|nr:AAA family ATPase [Nocardia coffeae]MBY8858626.1 ATP-binding protein [Nocardia coffeae]
MTESIEQVTRPVTIALVGTHSTGKTTFVNALADRLRRNRVDVAVVNDLGVNALELGLPILWNHTWASTMWIITRGISLELEAWVKADVLLVDRGIPDALGYYEAALAYRDTLPEPGRLEQLGRIVADHAQHYDLILRTELDPSIPLGAEKRRDADMRFRAMADRYVQSVLDRLGILHDVLPSDGHARALVEATALIEGRLPIVRRRAVLMA